MPSRPHLTDSVVGLLVAALLVVAALWVWQVCAMHAKEHGHDGVRPLFDFEGTQNPKGDAGRKEKKGGGGHVFIFAPGSLSTPLNSVAG